MLAGIKQNDKTERRAISFDWTKQYRAERIFTDVKWEAKPGRCSI